MVIDSANIIDIITAMTIKESVERIINHLPDNATMDDVNYHLYVYEKIKQADDSEIKFGLIDDTIAREIISKCLG